MTALDPRALRSAFGSFMTGVTVVTAKAADGTPIGFTANSFSSVSIDPPLLLVCPGKFLSSYSSFADCTRFAVNVLAEGQEDIANTFASYKGDRFARVAHHADALGNIMIDGALTQFSCTTHRTIEAGDHSILVGEVRAVTAGTGRGLGYVSGQYFSLGLERAALDPSGGKVLGGAIITRDDMVLLDRNEEGYCPPRVTSEDRVHLLKTLEQSLERRGQPVRLGPAYSVFDDGATHSSYFLATSCADGAGPFEAHGVRDLPNLKFSSAAIQDMMMRFATEAKTRSFGLYIGDAHRGDVHYPRERT